MNHAEEDVAVREVVKWDEEEAQLLPLLLPMLRRRRCMVKAIARRAL